MNDKVEARDLKKREKYNLMEDCYFALIEQMENLDIFEENLGLLRQIIEVIIWGDQNKVPFVSVSKVIIRNSSKWTSSNYF